MKTLTYQEMFKTRVESSSLTKIKRKIIGYKLNEGELQVNKMLKYAYMGTNIEPNYYKNVDGILERPYRLIKNVFTNLKSSFDLFIIKSLGKFLYEKDMPETFSPKPIETITVESEKNIEEQQEMDFGDRSHPNLGKNFLSEFKKGNKYVRKTYGEYFNAVINRADEKSKEKYLKINGKHKKKN